MFYSFTVWFVSVSFALVSFNLTTQNAAAQTQISCSYKTILNDIDGTYEIRPCFRANDRAVLISREPGSPINIRSGAGTKFEPPIHIGYAGDIVRVKGYSSSNNGYVWYEVRFIQSGAVGWVRGDFLRAVQ